LKAHYLEVLFNPLNRGITMQTEHLKVTGMTCGGCIGNVTEALKAIAGVSDVTRWTMLAAVLEYLPAALAAGLATQDAAARGVTSKDNRKNRSGRNDCLGS